MRLLLDTRVFLWLDSALERVPQRVRAACEDGANEVFLSLASVWEMQIKTSLGKLRLPDAAVNLVTPSLIARRSEHFLSSWRIFAHWVGLPANHGDPFDRMLAAQARHEGLILVTADQIMREYAVKVLWE